MTCFNINLQLFSGEKTEKATPKRRREAREKGQVLQTREINSAFILFFVFLAINFLGKYWIKEIYKFYIEIMSYTSNVDLFFRFENLKVFFISMLILIIKLILPILFISLIIGLLCSYMQVGFLFTTKTLNFKLDRINPINGFKRLFSIKSIVELIKSLFKTLVLIYIVSSYLKKEYYNILNVFDMEILEIVKYLWKIVFNLVFRCFIVLLFLAILDYMYKKWEYEKELKMSKQEVKEEFKQTEGDPLIKSKIKEKQRQISMKRMMQDVPKADVIITNPTHFAVAIVYNEEIDDAPKVIAKGKDIIAQNIKKIARENDIPLYENKPLAQTLYHTVEIGEYIPPELYQAVAEVLAYIYSLKNNL
ncbi:flagellar biosynthetic protein FlhB [Caminicella sporogenes DSM 14501]|uniref:Flagellar biosynthetic protein FlhB n=1 Tax=Caminicella sporogenes DSM 14501 TaxID=1121266 RepID=A0A1M6LB21_9FIRM|nr:flagellar biosynthesis protein FlhB [Caminicella sporogenes]RKD27770.1 flagellar biosynthesis protein FlhB [Caminicella sporogenes]WIF94653.1 flagellar biosynthesis protein FlhB [Caminicella sporogenes]SHJ68376.1 flagellar biosynthetic protein FlhB [Caminicella sporogenes DSM 14501]